MKLIFGIGVFGFFAFMAAFTLGPLCLAYDLNHLVPLFTHKTLNISVWNPAVILGGVFLSEVAIPVAILTFLLVSIGVIP